jgi:hypothetical protein
MSLSIVSLEGNALTGEVGSLVGDSTGDVGATISSTFEIETGAPDGTSAFKGAGLWGIVQRVYIEGQTEGQLITVALIIDNTVVTIGTVSTTVGTKQVMEAGIQRAGWIYGVRLTAAGLTKRIEISAIELDVYTSE